uniref:Microfibril associated protein 2 n=1 Tax=Amphilophus citrinellus TaxID=61819 RepID=A0A3Q0SSN4_AMPCI
MFLLSSCMCNICDYRLPTPARLASLHLCDCSIYCREEQYPCTRLYSVHKPCKQCLNSLCFYSLRRVYIINKEICVRTVCAHEELLRESLVGSQTQLEFYRRSSNRLKQDNEASCLELQAV